MKVNASMKGMKHFVLASLAAVLAFGIVGCNSAANEQEDVQEAQKKLNEEKADAAKED